MICAPFHLQLIIQIITSMRHHFSQNSIPVSLQHNIDHQSLESIPPGCQQQNITGILTFRVETNYLNTFRPSTVLRCKFWGMDGQGIVFEQISQTEKVLNLSIRSNLQNTTKYFKDMKAVCIEVLHLTTKEGFQVKKKLDYKQIGWIFITPQRFIINNVINSFEETVAIIDLKKQKIGEAKVKFNISMYHKEQLFPYSTHPNLPKPPSLTDIGYPTNIDSKNNYPNIRPNKDSDDKIEPIYQRLQQNNVRQSLTQEDEHFDKNQEISPKRDTKEDFLPQFKRKSKAEQYLEEYSKNKPKHTELSMLRDKFGYNYPSVEVMKLKFDQAKLLSNFKQDNIKEQSRINLLLKHLKTEQKTKFDYLIITCQQNSKKVKTQTKIILGQLNQQQKIDINHLYMLPNSPTDLLVFEIKEGKAEIEVHALKKTAQLDLKNKYNKTIAVLQFSTVSNQRVQQSKFKGPLIIPQSNKQTEPSKPIQQKKDHGYIYVEGWKQDKIRLNNKNFGFINANKIFFQISDPKADLASIQLQTDSKELVQLEVDLAHLFKEQNYVIKGQQVKIISSRGPIEDILTLLSKLEQQKSNKTVKQQPRPQNMEQQHFDNLKELTNIFEHLAESEEVQCNELIQLLLTSEKSSGNNLKKLSEIIEIQPKTFSNLLEIVFNNQFPRFFTMFQVYHRWNHKYRHSLKKISKIIDSSAQKKLLKSLHKLRKSSEVLFGAANSDSVLKQLLKIDLNTQKISEDLQSEPDYQALYRLIVLLFERYFNRSIKLNEVETFLTEPSLLPNLNTYMLTKIAFEINSEPELFKEYLNEQQKQLVHLFTVERQFIGEPGLAKLLLTSEQEELTESSMLASLDEHPIKHTQNEGYNIHTEQSKQRQFKEVEKHSDKEREQSERMNTQEKQNEQEPKNRNITVLLNKIQLNSKEEITNIQIANEHQRVQFKDQETSLPKAVLLIQGAVYSVVVQTNSTQFQGVLVATNEPQKIKLYRDNEQSGTLYLFQSPKHQIQESQIPFKLITTQKLFQSEAEAYHKDSFFASEPQIKCQEHPRAQSPKIKMIIRSVRPSRPDFNFTVSSLNNDQQKIIAFPKENQIVLDNSQKGWLITLPGENLQTVTVPNNVVSETYCLTNPSDRKVAYVIIVQICECWNPEDELKPKESLSIFLHLEQLISLLELQPDDLAIFLQSQEDITEITSITNPIKTRQLPISSCSVLKQTGQQLSIKIVSNKSKKQIAEFHFSLKLISESVRRCQRFLLSDQPGYRLKITVFQVRQEWKFCRPERILSLFNATNKKTIESWVKSVPYINQQTLISWLKTNFELTLGEIDIILNDLIPNDGNSYQQFLALFHTMNYQSLETGKEVEEEFKIFDLKDEGVISQQQMILVKKIMERNYQQAWKILQNVQTILTTSPQKQNNFIIDLVCPKIVCFDYLSFISLILAAHSQQSEKGKPKQIKRQSRYLKIKLLSFNKLSINGAPSTLLFKVDNKQLAEPVHRCFSYSYSACNSAEVVVQNSKNLNLDIYCQRLNMEGCWEYKLIQKVPLACQIKILGGTINLQINQTDQLPKLKQPSQSHQYQNAQNIKAFLNSGQPQFKESSQLNLDRHSFQKSFWNKSLNETKQRWAKSIESAPKQKRKINIDSSQLKKKMDLFEKFNQI